MTNLSEKIEKLYSEQSKDWQLFAASLEGLSKVEHKEIVLENNKVIAQFNPARIISTSAKIDSKSVGSRPCFLCPVNRPSQQKAVELPDFEYLFLVNPFPVVVKHFTVVHKQHRRQEPFISDYFRILSALGSGWALVFNGAKAGASAPDHLHFQVVPSVSLPLYASVNDREPDLAVAKQIFIYAGMSFVLASSDSIESISEYSMQILAKIENAELLNIVAWKQGEKFICFIMPRSKHRPDCYFRQDNQQLLLSPGAMELSGIWIFPRAEDYGRISHSQLLSIAREVTLSPEQAQRLI